MSLSEQPTIALLSGNLGNRIYQFFAAYALLKKAGIGTISNCNFPEWNINYPSVSSDSYRRYVVIRSTQEFDMDQLAFDIETDPSVFIKFSCHMQDHRFYLGKSSYESCFPRLAEDYFKPSKNDIVINIRTAEVLSGKYKHYPLVPISFYISIVKRMGLRPVIMGQLTPSLYVSQLRSAFPEAVFVESQGARKDFETIRSAYNIIPAVSTFSLAAAWLSDATYIHLPLTGFLNPAHMRDINLIPINDLRYRYYLFPMNFALPEKEALSHHEYIEGRWKEISKERVTLLKTSAPFIAENHTADFIVTDFDEEFYVHHHRDVAEDISNGWYANGLHHYLNIGRSMNYRVSSMAQTSLPTLPNLALGQKAWQSSRSQWSRGISLQEDAMRAVNGNRTKEIGFHTASESEPWWIVDCGLDFKIRSISIYNRKGPRILQERAAPLKFECSRDLNIWTILKRTADDFVFGSELDDFKPFSFTIEEPIITRYIKISIPGRKSILHLTEVEVYGIPF